MWSDGEARSGEIDRGEARQQGLATARLRGRECGNGNGNGNGNGGCWEWCGRTGRQAVVIVVVVVVVVQHEYSSM